MIVYPDGLPQSADTFRQRTESALQQVAAPEGGSPLGTPNPKGVFKGDINGNQLVTELGARSEHYKDVSRRLLLLLESQPLWNEDLFDTLRAKIVDAYTQAIAADPSKHFVLLMNDLMRYFRTICVHYHNEMVSEYGKWPIRNIKLRHSRVIMYSSLIVVIGELSKFSYAAADADQKLEHLKRYIGYPPLERFVRVYEANEDDNLFRLLGPYNHFLQKLSDEKLRGELADIDYNDRYSRSEFASLKSNSDALAAEISRFMMTRRGQWSDRFFEYLLV
jgi:hypothetical protein